MATTDQTTLTADALSASTDQNQPSQETHPPQQSTTANLPQPLHQPVVPNISPDEHLEQNVTAETFTTHDVVLGKGNGINSLPGNLQFRKIIVKYKPLYASTPRSLKGTVAELVINEIACLGGKFLEPQADQRFREVSRKRAIEKTCQALREKKNNVGPSGAAAAAPRPQQVSPDHQQQEESIVYPPPTAVPAATAAVAAATNHDAPVPMDVEKEKPDEKDDIKPDKKEKHTHVDTIMENDVLYGGRGRRHFHRVANQRFLDLVKQSRKEYHDSRCKKVVAKRIVEEWQSQDPPGRFLQQDPVTEKWYEIKESRIMEKTCQALRDLKRERGPAGIKQGITERMVDPWEKMPYQMHNTMNGPMQPQQHMHPVMNGQNMAPGPHPYHQGPWMNQPMYNPQNMMQGGMIPPPPHMPPPYMQRPPQGGMPGVPSQSAGIGQGQSSGTAQRQPNGIGPNQTPIATPPPPQPLPPQQPTTVHTHGHHSPTPNPITNSVQLQQQQSQSQDEIAEITAEEKVPEKSAETPEAQTDPLPVPQAKQMDVDPLSASDATQIEKAKEAETTVVVFDPLSVTIPAPLKGPSPGPIIGSAPNPLAATVDSTSDVPGPTPPAVPANPRVSVEPEKQGAEVTTNPDLEHTVTIIGESQNSLVTNSAVEVPKQLEATKNITPTTQPEASTTADTQEQEKGETNPDTQASVVDDVTTREGAKHNPDDKEKGGDKRKNGELEAAALLANMFR